MVEWHDTTLTVELWRGEGSEEIITTDEHPFYVEGKGFTPAAKLTLGDVVRLAGDRLSVVGNFKRNFNGQLAYNLSVLNDHTYFVGQSRAWVHNCDVNYDQPFVPDEYWSRKAPVQVMPGIRQTTTTKLSSDGVTSYRFDSFYDQYGRMTGQAHYTNHPNLGGMPHPNPHHHVRNPHYGDRSVPNPQNTNVREWFVNPQNGTKVFPGPFPGG